MVNALISFTRASAAIWNNRGFRSFLNSIALYFILNSANNVKKNWWKQRNNYKPIHCCKWKELQVFLVGYAGVLIAYRLGTYSYRIEAFIFSVPFKSKYGLPFLIWWTSCFLKDGSLENLSSVADAQTLMSLYFALCTKVTGYCSAAHRMVFWIILSTNSMRIASYCQKHSLLQRVFAIYGSLPQAAKQVLHPTFPAMPIDQILCLFLFNWSWLFCITYYVFQAVHKQVPILIRTIRSSTDLLGIISDAPADSRELLMQVQLELFFAY
jgi:hypothetical protein